MAPSVIIASRLYALQLGHLAMYAVLSISPLPFLVFSYPFSRSLPLRIFSFLMLTLRITPPPAASNIYASSSCSPSSISAAAHDPLRGAAMFNCRKPVWVPSFDYTSALMESLM